MGLRDANNGTPTRQDLTQAEYFVAGGLFTQMMTEAEITVEQLNQETGVGMGTLQTFISNRAQPGAKGPFESLVRVFRKSGIAEERIRRWAQAALRDRLIMVVLGYREGMLAPGLDYEELINHTDQFFGSLGQQRSLLDLLNTV